MTKVHIVNHTHWDREWYFTSADSLVLSEQLFTDIIEELVSNPTATFVLDGQISILDDYLQLYPDKIELVKRLVAEERLYVGPWFTQTDGFFANGESILRNLMIGIYETKKYGAHFPMGYLPDTFGLNAQFPLLLRECGFDNLVFWRGLHLGSHVEQPYFKWQSLNGESEVFALNLPQGYGSGMLLEPTEAYVKGRLDPAVDFILKYGAQKEILIPSGNDQLNIITDLSEKIEQINEIGKYSYQASSYQAFLKYVKQKEDLEIYQGEFREPVLARVHKSVGSSRMNIKLALNELEAILVKRIEPLLVIAKKCGIKISNQLLFNAWKKVLEGQAHDSLAGCVSDSVTADIMHRCKEAKEMLAGIENTITKRIADQLELSDREVLFFNTDGKEFKGYKKTKILSPTKQIEFIGYPDATILSSEYVPSRKEILEETPAGNRVITEAGYWILTVLLKVSLPGLGYQVVSFKPASRALAEVNQAEQTSISNEFYTIRFSGKSLDLIYADGQEIKDFIEITDEGNDGDTYDFSPLPSDKTLLFKLTKSIIETSDLYQKITVCGSTVLPRDLTERQQGKVSTPVAVKISLSLYQGKDEIHGSVTIDNQVDSHRVRLSLKQGQPITEAVASLPFGFIKRVNKPVENWQATYSEKPVNIEPFETTLSTISQGRVLTAFTRGMKEYEYQADTLFITLLATTGELGKPNLLHRPGRASGDTTKKGHVQIATPDAQLRGEQTFQFVLRYDDTFNEGQISKWRNALEQPSISYQRQQLNFFMERLDNKIQKGRLPLPTLDTCLSLLNLPTNYLVSSIYPAYYSDDVIVRLENPTKDTLTIDPRKFSAYNVERVNVLEEASLAQDFTIAPYAFMSLKLSERMG